MGTRGRVITCKDIQGNQACPILRKEAQKGSGKKKKKIAFAGKLLSLCPAVSQGHRWSVRPVVRRKSYAQGGARTGKRPSAPLFLSLTSSNHGEPWSDLNEFSVACSNSGYTTCGEREWSWKPEWALAIVRFSLQQEALLGTAGSLRVYQTMEIGPRAKVKKKKKTTGLAWDMNIGLYKSCRGRV